MTPEIAYVCESCEVANELHVFSQTGCPVLYESDACFHELRRSNPTNQVRGYHPTSILHPNKLFSDSVELCETEVCFLYIELIGTNVYDFQKRTMFHPK